MISLFFFFNDTATTEIYTLSLHDALPICPRCRRKPTRQQQGAAAGQEGRWRTPGPASRAHRTCPARLRSEEHTSELQSQSNLVCRLLLEKKNNTVVYMQARRVHTHRPMHR